MAQTFLTIDMITLEALAVLENNLVFSKLVNRQFDDHFAVDGAEVGDTINVRVPPKYRGRTGSTMVPEDITERKIPVTLGDPFGVDITFTTRELLLEMGNFSERYLIPAAARIANKIDEDGAALITEMQMLDGTPGTLPDNTDTFLDANARLDERAAPMDEYRSAVISPRVNAKLVRGMQGLFNDRNEVSRQYRDGWVGHVSGLDFFRSQNLPMHHYGTGGNTANNAERAQMRSAFSQPTSSTDDFPGTSSEIALDGFANSTSDVVREGDILTIAGVYEINPQSFKSTGELKQFRVTEDADSNGSGQADVTVEPGIVYSATPNTANHPHENYWTCIGLPANNANVTIIGAGSGQRKQGVVMHRDAFCLAAADMPIPAGVDFAGRKADARLGLSLRIIRQYTINDDKMPCRFDALYGWVRLRPELGVRLAF